MSSYTKKEIVDELIETFPELTRDGAIMLVNEVVAGLIKAVERGDDVVLNGLFSIGYTVRSRTSGYFGQKSGANEPVPTKVAKVRVAEALRTQIRELPISPEEMEEWEAQREYNRKRRASFMYERNSNDD